MYNYFYNYYCGQLSVFTNKNFLIKEYKEITNIIENPCFMIDHPENRIQYEAYQHALADELRLLRKWANRIYVEGRNYGL